LPRKSRFLLGKRINLVLWEWYLPGGLSFRIRWKNPIPVLVIWKVSLGQGSPLLKRKLGVSSPSQPRTEGEFGRNLVNPEFFGW